MKFEYLINFLRGVSNRFAWFSTLLCLALIALALPQTVVDMMHEFNKNDEKRQGRW